MKLIVAVPTIHMSQPPRLRVHVRVCLMKLIVAVPTTHMSQPPLLRVSKHSTKSQHSWTFDSACLCSTLSWRSSSMLVTTWWQPACCI